MKQGLLVGLIGLLVVSAPAAATATPAPATVVGPCELVDAICGSTCSIAEITGRIFDAVNIILACFNQMDV